MGEQGGGEAGQGEEEQQQYHEGINWRGLARTAVLRELADKMDR